MSKRDTWIAAGVVFGFAAAQSPMAIPLALVLLGRWVYLDAKARRVCNHVAWAIMVPLTWLFMLPVYLATRPLTAGEIRSGGILWNILRGFTATYAAGATVILLRYARMIVFALVWRAMGGGTGSLDAILQFVGILAASIVLPAVAALGVGVLLRRTTVEIGPTGPLAVEAKAG
jgi:hypothetical protein